MTTDELNTIVQAVVAELEKSGVDFDYKAEQAKDDDLVFVIRGTAPDYQGVTVTWKGLLDIITAQATQAKNDAVTAKNTANTILTQVTTKESNVSTMKSEVSEMKASVETTKSQVEGMKNAVETTKGQVETMKTSIETTKEEVETMKTSVETSKSQVDTMKTSIETTKGEVETLKGQAETAKETATQKAAETTQAKSDVELMKASVEQTVTDFNALADQKKSEVQGVYQNDFNELKGDLDEVQNEKTIIKLISNSFVKSNGEFANDPSYSRTDYIDIEGYSRIICYGTLKSSYNAFYGANKEFIDPTFNVDAGVNSIVIPNNAKYVVFSNLASNMDDFYVESKRKINGTSIDDAFELLQAEQQNTFPFKKVKYEYVSNNGKFLKDMNWCRSDFISVEKFSSLRITTTASSIYNAFYDSNKEKLSTFSLSIGNNVVPIPSAAKYAVISNTIQAMYDTRIASYLDQYISTIGDTVVSPEKLVETSENLFNKDGEITVGKIIGPNGTLITASNSIVSDYIPVIPGCRYTQMYVNKTWTIGGTSDAPKITDINDNYSFNRNYVAFYDSQKGLLGASNTEPYSSPLIPSGCKYIRCAIPADKVDTFMVIPDSLRSPYNGILYADYEPSTAYDIKYATDKRIESVVSDKFSTIKGIARLGYNVHGVETPPQQTIASYDLACEKGFEYLLADVAFTADNVAVCFHDTYIGSNYPDIPLRNDGTQIDNTEHTITIASYTYAEWTANYDFGLYKGEQYRGTKLLTVDEFIRYCKAKGKKAYLENKVELTTAQIEIIANILKRYHMEEYTTYATNTSPANVAAQVRLEELCPNLKTIAFMPEMLTDNAKNAFNAVKKNGVEVIWFGWGDYILTDDIVSYLIENGISYETGSFDNDASIVGWLKLGANMYCTGIESGRTVASKSANKYAEKLV